MSEAVDELKKFSQSANQGKPNINKINITTGGRPVLNVDMWKGDFENCSAEDRFWLKCGNRGHFIRETL